MEANPAENCLTSHTDAPAWAAADGKDPGLQKLGHLVRDAGRIAPITDRSAKPVRDPELALGLAQQQQAAIGRQLATIETNCELLAQDGW